MQQPLLAADAVSAYSGSKVSQTVEFCLYLTRKGTEFNTEVPYVIHILKKSKTTIVNPYLDLRMHHQRVAVNPTCS